MPKKEEKPRKKLVVEEVETPVDSEVVSSTELEKEESHSPENLPGEIPEEAAKTEAPEIIESPSEEMEKEIHQEESHLHDIHTGAATPLPQKQGSPVLWILIPGIFLLGALLGGIVFYQKMKPWDC